MPTQSRAHGKVWEKAEHVVREAVSLTRRHHDAPVGVPLCAATVTMHGGRAEGGIVNRACERYRGR